MHECWIAGWGNVNANFKPVFYLLGYHPGDGHQVMISDYDGGPVRTTFLRNGIGVAHIVGLGRYCAVIAYGSSTVRTYYQLYRNRLVNSCHWK